MSALTEIITILVNGLQTGAIYILLAVGLSIILGTLKFVNFAHGALYLIGAYAGLVIAYGVSLSDGKLHEWGITELNLGLGYVPALLLVPLLVFVIGLGMERFVARPFYDRPDTDQILVTFGLAIVVEELIRILFGPGSFSFRQPEFPPLPLLDALPIATYRYYVILITALLVLVVYLLVEYTDFGLVVRAGTRDAEMVRLLGVKITRPYIVVFGIGAALAGVAGVVGGPIFNNNPTIGTDVLVPSFLTVVIGGVGSIVGAVIGGVLFGLIYSVLVAYAPAWAQIGIYVLAAVILLVRPQGILGDEEVAP